LIYYAANPFTLHHLPESGAGRGLLATVGRDPTAAMPGDRAHYAPPPPEIYRDRHEPPRPEPQQPRAPSLPIFSSEDFFDLSSMIRSQDLQLNLKSYSCLPTRLLVVKKSLVMTAALLACNAKSN
jgi:hypothetical protein